MAAMILEGPDAAVRSEVRAGVGWLTLDRPEALNALNLTMIRSLRDALESWRDDDDVAFVTIDSTSGKAFSAGGDIRGVRAAVLAGEGDRADTFFQEEYALNLCIDEYPKPYLALIDGICFGGGLGISVHGRYRVVTERARLAMPETAIGFVPDVGASYFLRALPPGLGRAMALTGLAIGGADAVTVGLGTHFVASEELAALRSALSSGDNPATILARLTDPVPPGARADDLTAIAATFAERELSDVIDRLNDADTPWTDTARAGIASASPLSLQITDAMLQAGTGVDLAACLQIELAVVKHVIRTSDFDQGVRARLVDKDNQPTWVAGIDLINEIGTALEILHDAARAASEF